MKTKEFLQIFYQEIEKIKKVKKKKVKKEEIWEAIGFLYSYPNSEILETLQDLLVSYYLKLGGNMKELQDNMFKTLTNKASEYQGLSEDRLINFNRPAQKVGISPISVCLGYMLKHIDSIMSVNFSKKPELLLEKFTDAVNYCIFLKALIKENQNFLKDVA